MRGLLALFALLSGLAAVGAPANAAMLSEACEQVASSETSQSGKQSQCECRADRKPVPGKSGSGKACKPRKPVIIYIPTVQMGIDRAYE
ncbi:hypothetical protein [Pontixanthobacter gangjinensis]|uniref:Uncharacterized protein n=1 Tax=Pontixanthobacter gangjinensis TaxID=1028742 RepID=A0A6I4SNG6_9SPHN|nr:hypothetical protein [Pontixanthobacter gangjinensis]MXO57189.1 hypothetical protein [Pontixanthobacter gangjinensis]